ncbi:hypothetical protein VKN79_04325 [Fusobacterium polymorphum]|jgi:hypothetical protein|nr:hypothetical protein [Fusobacterium polymorphum]WRL78495.1 hypothetical protein VKN79_04325 [Fusobacterium polymorphum]
MTNGKIVSIIDNGLTRQGNQSYAIFIDAKCLFSKVNNPIGGLLWI